MLTNPNILIEVVAEDITGKFIKKGTLLSNDIYNILIKDKPNLLDYQSLTIVRVVGRFYRFGDSELSELVRYYDIHTLCAHGTFNVPISEHIFDLTRRIREDKLNILLE